MVKKILISQPKPTSEKSPYYDIERDCEVQLVFRPFIKVEGISAKEFRQQKVDISEYSAIVFTSRHAIDHFFGLAKELRVTLSDKLKYFCVTESIALYIQKYAPYRKRKVFFGTSGKVDDLVPFMIKHNTERYLVPLSDVANDSISKLMDRNNLNHRECYMYRTVSNNFTDEEIKNFDYDMLAFFSPSGIKALQENFPDMKPGEVKIAVFGPATAKAAKDIGLHPDVEAPTEKYPSMTSALRHYLLSQD